MANKKYLEIIQTKDEKVVKRMDVSTQSERSIDRLERGMNINLNQTDYHIKVKESETELPVGQFK